MCGCTNRLGVDISHCTKVFKSRVAFWDHMNKHQKALGVKASIKCARWKRQCSRDENGNIVLTPSRMTAMAQVIPLASLRIMTG